MSNWYALWGVWQANPMDETDADLHGMRDYLLNLRDVKQKHLESVMRKSM